MPQDGTGPSSLATFVANNWGVGVGVGGGIIADRQGSGVWGAAQLDSSSPHRAKLHGDPLLGRLSEVFPPIRVEPVLQAHRWEVLRTDLPALDPSRLAPPDQMASLVDVLRSRTPQRGRIKWSRARAVASKTPTSAFPQFATIWRRNLGVADDGGLPHIYHLWANSTKAERRTPLSKLRSTSGWRVA